MIIELMVDEFHVEGSMVDQKMDRNDKSKKENQQMMKKKHQKINKKDDRDEKGGKNDGDKVQ